MSLSRLLYLPVAAVMAVLQSLPLGIVAWLGRRLGGLAWWLDWRHRRQALINLDIAYGATLPRQARERIARDNFRLLGEAFLCALKTAAMDRGELASRLQVVGLSKLQPWIERSDVRGVVIATGHFGNIEMYDLAARNLPWMEVATVYQPSPSPVINQVLQRVRRDCRCRFIAQGTESKGLRALLREGNLVLGLMGDVNAGSGGLSVPFFGHPASTSAAPAVYALRYRMPLHAAVCFRTGAGRWRVEISDEIPTAKAGKARRVEEILLDLNRHFERSVQRDPANWCWPQPRWEHGGRVRRRQSRAATA